MSKELNKAPVEQAGGDERDFQAKGAQEVPSPVSKEYDRHLISLLRKGEALPGHQEEAADEIERLRDWNDHLNNTVLPNILNPNFLMLMKGGERLLDLCTKDGEFIGVSLNDMKDVFDWMVTHARIAPDQAALAQPSPAPELAERGTQHRFSTTEQTCRHDFAGVWWNDNGETKTGRECRHCGFFVADVTKAQAEQAEAERPEVVAWQYRVTAGPQTGWSLWHPGKGEEFERSYTVERRPLMTVAQHERIVGELRAKLQAAEDRADTLEHRMMGMMTRHFAEAWRNRDTQKALDGYLSAGIAQLEQERDAALAEVERLRQFERICEGLPQDAIDGGWTVQGIRCYAKRLEDQLKSALARVAELTANRNRYGVDAHYFNKNLQRILRDFESFTPDELARSLIILAKVADEKVVAQHSVPEGFIGRLSEFLAQRGATGKALLRELRDMLAAAPARGQHSVPAYVSYTTRPAESLAGIALRQLKDESRWVEIRDINAHAFPDMQSHSYYPAGTVIKLPAAAPGKEGV
ncbi:LysM peptidoglycan-binding domain-containing protein [Pseudomonas aeruginosa]|nr:hypothetical protein [Pseudomonas aeruginosa]